MMKEIRLTRRSFHRHAACVVGAGALAVHGWPTTAMAQPNDGEGPRVISQLTHYHGWPTVAKAPNGELFAVCSGGRESHVCPFGRVEMMRSKNEGKTWSWPRVVLDGPIDDRDAGVLITSKGTVIITTFTSLAYEPLLKNTVSDSDKHARWLSAHRRLDEKGRQNALGVWAIRSEDGGATFSKPVRSLVNSPHGPIELSDGRLLYAGKALWDEPSRVGVCVSNDDGRSWEWLSEIPTRPGDDPDQYHELHAVETADETLIVQIRNHNSKNSRETLQCHSHDGGKSWSTPRSIGVWGLPSHLLRLKDGRLLMSYGHRRPPFGNQARISEDHGATWADPLIISDDGAGGDLGYPSTVELKDGQFLSIWYEKLKSSSSAVLRQRRWRLA